MAVTANGIPITSSNIKDTAECPVCGAERGTNCIDSEGRRKSSGSIHLLRRHEVYKILHDAGAKIERVTA